MTVSHVISFVERRKWWLFSAWWLHVVLFHWLVLGFMSWDAFGYRGVPIVELVQHGNLGAGKYSDWAQTAYLPFLELVHVPFLLVAGLRGFLLGFPLVLFPLAVVAVYRLARELTDDRTCATFAAFAYCALPMVNQQPFSGYVDFAVTGVLAYFLYALVRVTKTTGSGRFVRLAIATFLLSMSRSQGLYIAIFVLPFLGYVLFCTRVRLRIRLEDKRAAIYSGLAVLAGAMPEIAHQIYKYVEYGSPIAPAQLKLFGIVIGTGVPMDSYMKYAGLGGDDWGSLLKGFWEGWVFHSGWPIGAFYGSRFMGAGLIFIVAILLLPAFWRRASRLEKWIVAVGAIASLLSKDFAVPRYGYTTMISVALIIGRTVPALASDAKARSRFAAGAVVLILIVHLLRPEVDYYQVRKRWISPRMNVAASPLYVRGHDTLKPFPNKGYKFVIIDSMHSQLTLPIYGRGLSNEVLRSFPSGELGPRCGGLAPILAEHPEALFVDDSDKTADCERTCEFKIDRACRAWRIVPQP